MDVKRAYDLCVQGIAGFVRDAGFTDVVLGLSGGIDSSLVCVMAADALGADHVHGALLPGPYSTDHSVDDALELARNVGVSTCTISIVDAYRALAESYVAGTGSPLAGLASENTQARLRMTAIMALSNAHGWMMLNTGNRSEAAMGYSTLYGDTAGAFAPIGGIYKTDVYKLCRFRNEEARSAGEVPPIPQRVLDKPPSAELSADQSDESSMGITYEDLDAILRLLVDEGMTLDGVVAAGMDAALVSMVAERYAANAFKRALEPDFVVIDGPIG